MASRDAEVRALVAELNRHLTELRATVAALNTVLLPPGPDASEEQVVT